MDYCNTTSSMSGQVGSHNMSQGGGQLIIKLVSETPIGQLQLSIWELGTVETKIVVCRVFTKTKRLVHWKVRPIRNRWRW